jgi:asparaginyl-tRNA synthetase
LDQRLLSKVRKRRVGKFVKFLHVKEVLRGRHEGEKVAVRGWVYRKRESKQTVFLLVRDSTGVVQCTVKANSKSWTDAERLTIESSLWVEGEVRRDERASGGYEIAVEKLSVIGLAEVFPISKDKSEEFLRDMRHLWLRSRRMNLVMKVRDRVLRAAREFFSREEFFEVSPPMFISAAVEGGSTLFGLKYFDQDLYLTQSSQLYLEVLIYSLDKVYCIAPSFRAEKSRTIRHLTEYWHIEAEWPFADIRDLMRFEEELFVYVCSKTAENCKKEFDELGADISKVASVKMPFPKITYTEAVERLKKTGSKMKWGEDFGYDDEKTLAEGIGKPFFVYDYPTAIKAFYCKIHRDHPALAMSTDMLVPRIGEISTGGAREDDKETLIRRIREMGLREQDYEWYVDLRRYGTVPHVGFGMGLERVLTWMLDLENIIDSIPFPRTIRRFYP